MNLVYLVGDATEPQLNDYHKGVIVHCCNNIGAWGAGFVLALSKKWSEPEKQYRAMSKYNLGDIQIVPVEENLSVCNLIGQNGIRSYQTPVPVDYAAIKKGLEKLKIYMIKNNIINLIMPRIGCGLAGGKWGEILKILDDVFADTKIVIEVYSHNVTMQF